MIELRAVVRAYNDTLRALNRRAAAIDPIDLAQATALVAELESLDREREFLDLYRGGLTRAEAASLPRNPTTALAWELVRRGVAAKLTAARGKNAGAWRGLLGRVERAAKPQPRGLAGS
jgi:hypothetical protein